MLESPRMPPKSAYLVMMGVAMAIISTLPICRLLAFWRSLNTRTMDIILNKNHPNYERSGIGCQFLSGKWVNFP